MSTQISEEACKYQASRKSAKNPLLKSPASLPDLSGSDWTDRAHTAPARQILQRGHSVCIHGMKRRPELNGAFACVVQDTPDESGRICVQIKSSAGFDSGALRAPDWTRKSIGKHMLIRADRLHAPLPDLVSPAGRQTHGHRGFARKANGSFYDRSRETL
mmetsp:Transcript_86232/g.136106  ORF Transcript_86232/g.136106 Transcript_86232/m.136106 type:complete len:160 (+) Transcript_86232:93-572(+)